MGYKLTSKMEVIGSQIQMTPIAFPDTQENLDAFATWVDWETWVENNKIVNGPDNITLPDNTNNPNCYMGLFDSNTVDGLNVTVINIL